MPPKPKFSKEEIIDAALDIVSRDGVAALTARGVPVRRLASCEFEPAVPVPEGPEALLPACPAE